ncbi:hypothetical protein PTSG_02683 [Salpingoeca rosetta]|uniref:Uncharacterized protein n=1 Tax=Salpingoeca rosetta (strain ATCC 50818 / BSB-021) TaxID=946362 RepID=F2U302_SALR5|nr:uncharacterized protein PTSG_02683 [Salpingoeca rosetta]EGD81996.1 hypothetical protein PTSG_02683 [Salpingoeca rosetta]|eukprot:XP_004996179.1 hypothetical protein PTSG_02683 [Salpingoeca rosetta]
MHIYVCRPALTASPQAVEALPCGVATKKSTVNTAQRTARRRHMADPFPLVFDPDVPDHLGIICPRSACDLEALFQQEHVSFTFVDEQGDGTTTRVTWVCAASALKAHDVLTSRCAHCAFVASPRINALVAHHRDAPHARLQQHVPIAGVSVTPCVDATHEQHGWLQAKEFEAPTASTPAASSQRREPSQQTQQQPHEKTQGQQHRRGGPRLQQGLEVRITACPMGLHELCTILAHHDGVVDIECLPEADVVAVRPPDYQKQDFVGVACDERGTRPFSTAGGVSGTASLTSMTNIVSRVTGSVDLALTTTPTSSHLRNLTSLTHVGGYLDLSSNDFDSIDFGSVLVRIDGYLDCSTNSLLNTINFGALTTVSGYLDVTDTDLTQLDCRGLGSCIRADSSVSTIQCPQPC